MKSYQQRSMLNTKNPIGPAEQLSLGKKKKRFVVKIYLQGNLESLPLEMVRNLAF